MAEIRLYDPSRDRAGLETCFIALQEHERSLDPDLLPGAEVAAAYVNQLFAQCAESDGRIFVADDGGEVVGYVAVFARVTPQHVDTAPTPYAYLSDLAVLEASRGAGLGRALLERAEAFARERGAVRIRLHVLARNRRAFRLYESYGYRDYERFLEHPLDEGD